MNKIFKVIYSKTRYCYVVVSELAKSHCKTTQSHTVRSKTALTAAVLIALGGVSFITNPEVAYANLSGDNAYYLGISKANTDRTKDENANGKGATGTDSITIGHNSTAGTGTITIGDRRADNSKYSVYLGEHYTSANQQYPDPGNYVTSIGYNSDARGTGSIALGSGAEADVNRASEGHEQNPDADNASVAIGYQAKANKNNIAIGAKSVASDAASTTPAAFTNQVAPKSYVSVGDGKEGSDTRYRRISNVADGAADSDAATIAQLKQAVVATDASKKANIDASNIGENLKFKADGKTTADSSDKKTNEDAWGGAIGTGSIANSNTNGSGQLVTGTTVYNYVSPKAVDGKELKYISEDKSTGTNLGILDDKVSTNATDITGLKSLSNITDNGKTVIKKAAVGAVKVTAGDRITVTPDSKNLTDADTVTYTISAKNDGKVASGNSGLVSGDTVYQALQNQTKSLTYNNGWGIIVDNSTKKISLNKNLTTKIIEGWRNDPSRLVEFKLDKTAMAIGGAIFNNSGSGNSYVDGLTMTINSDGPYSVSLGGINNSTKGRYSTVTGGAANVASGYASSVNGGKNNTASGKYATVIGGGYLWTEVYDNGDFPDVDNSIFGSYAYARNDASGDLSTVVGGHANKASGKQSLVAGGSNNSSNEESASVFGGADNIAAKWLTTVSGGLGNIAENNYSSIYGGIMNRAEGIASTASGGYYNIIASNGPIQPNEIWYGSQSSGRYGSAFGGAYNLVGGESGAAIGGGHSVVYGERSVGLAGGSTGLGAHYALAAGYQSVVTSKGSKLLTSDKHDEFTDDYHYDRYGYAHKITIKDANETAVDLMPEYVDVATAVGYQATANETNTVSFGHDVGDVSGYAVKWKERTDKDERGNINRNLDGSINDYTKVPDVIANHYDTAKYNRLVKVADGINNHDAVVMEQLRNADNVGKNAKNNVVVYKKNADGSLQVDEYGEAIVDDEASKAETEKATEQAIKDSGDAWGRALGTGKVEANNSQLVTGDTVYNAIQNQAEWKLTTNGESADKAAAIKPGTTVDFSAEKKGKDHSNVTISHEGSNVTIGLDKEIVLGDTTHGNGGSLNVYSDSSDGNNQSNHVSINGSTISVNYPQNVEGKTSDARGVILGVGKEDGKPDGYIAFNNVEGGYTYLHASTDASEDKKGRLEYVGTDGNKKYIANLDDVSTAVNNAKTKYYSVNENLPKVDNYSNESNDGAVGMGSIAAGFNTHADGIASTVAGSYSRVINTGDVKLMGYDLRGATALSYGTFNDNQSTAQSGVFSGVANSIVGQANATTDSNAAIIYGAGNTVTNSYRPIDTSKFDLGKVEQDIAKKDAAAVAKDLQEAVPTSGGQVMVMGGGNNVESAYMTQVVGVGNTVKGNQVQNDKSEWVTDKSIKDYNPERSSQYNYVDGFSNEVINGKHDYVIGANNTVTGDSYDDKDAKKYSNESNIIFGDNHTVTNTKNAVIIGSSDTQMTLDQGDRATAIGHNASAQRDALAVGVNTQARGNAVALGTYSTAHNNSIAIGTKATAVSSQNLAIGWEAHIGNIATDDEQIKNAVALGSDSQVKVNDLLESDNNRGVLSIGDKDKERRIIHVRAGVNDTDAVNVSQLKSVQSGLTDKGLKFAANSGNEYTAKLGSTVTIQGTKKTEGHEYTADNLTTEIDEKGNITILMDKDMSVEKLAVNGKNGKDGAPGTPGSIGISGQDGQSSVGIDGKDGISIKGNDGKDGVTIKVDNGKDGKDGSEGHIGLTGRDGSSADIIVKKGYDDKDKGINGANGVDGKNGITRIVYTDAAGDHQVATMEDGLKFKGDDTTVINKKLNNTLDIIGGAKGDLTEGNIGVNSDGDKLKVQLSKDLTGMNSTTYTTTTGEGESATTSTTVVNGNGLTITDGPSITNKGIDGGNKVITNVGSGIETDANGKYTVTDQNKGNAANIGDVQNMVNEAVNSAADTTNKALAGKANVDASNIGANLKGEDGKTPATEEEMTKNENAWGSAIGTGKIEANNGQLVTGKTVYEYNKPVAENGKPLNYVSEGKTTGQNLGALDAQVKNNADAIKKNSESIQNITNNVKNLSDNAVQYDKDSNKTKVTLGGEGGTTITNVKDGALSDSSTDAVNGKQLYAEQQAREKADAEINQKVTNNTNEITKIKNGDFTDASKTAIHNIAKNAVKVVDGKNTTVTTVDGTDTTPTTYAVNVEGTGEVASGDKGLISGDTIYNELRPSADGSYIKKDSTTAQNLVSLDTQVRKTSDLINSDGKSIKIGGSDAAMKIDVNGKDGKGRVITGVVSDANDPNSAANVGYVNGLTAANTQQIYRDMNNAYSRLDTNINRAAAGSNALAALHPLDFDPADKASFAVGYGHYRNANAAAVGAFYQPNANTMVNMGISLGNGDPGFNAGVSFKIGKGSAYNGVSKAEMAQTIHDQATEISAIKADDAAKDKRIDALEKENQEMKKQIQEILARLNG